MSIIGKFKRKVKGKLLYMLNEAHYKYIGFTPFYSRWRDISSKYPDIYNSRGEKMKIFFLSDRDFAHIPYGGDVSPCYFLWDRYNYGLKTHFYTRELAFKPVGNPDRKFAVLGESRAIIPQVYDKFLREKSYIENNFDELFTFNEEVLNTISNAKFAPLNANFWYGVRDKEAFKPDNYLHKDKNISIIASNKEMVPMHLIRQQTALNCLKLGLADAFGKFTGGGGGYVPIELPFRRYRFSIAIENDITKFYFTEKITNCFAAQTIPVYLGATEIHKFFNPDGIITISMNDLDNLEQVLKQCTPAEYERRLPAVLDNFERVKQYAQVWDWLYVHHMKKYFNEE